MKIEIKHRFTLAVIFSTEATSVKDAVVIAANEGADLSRADLSGADLSGADLSGADLSGADLSGADLSGADLSGA
ncbi:MAG: pentapeptide repeat-containing protein, partial [Thiothrix sp.]